MQFADAERCNLAGTICAHIIDCSCLINRGAAEFSMCLRISLIVIVLLMLFVYALEYFKQDPTVQRKVSAFKAVLEKREIRARQKLRQK